MKVQTNNSDADWVQCPAGMIQNVANSVKVDFGSRNTAVLDRRQILTAAATVAGVAVLGGVLYSTSDNGSSGEAESGNPMMAKNHAGISCADVVAVLPAYIASEMQDQQEVAKVAKHIELCQKCREFYQYQLNS